MEERDNIYDSHHIKQFRGRLIQFVGFFFGLYNLHVHTLDIRILMSKLFCPKMLDVIKKNLMMVGTSQIC